MQISDVLRVKGTQVITVTPDTKVRQLLAVLAERRIGAVVVSGDGTAVDGIASERDIVQALAQRGAAVMSEPVTAIYTAEVHTVTPQTPVEEVMRMMTERRVRHAPVVVDGSLHGIVSIGDVVKIRLGELETERTALTDYITGARLRADPAHPAGSNRAGRRTLLRLTGYLRVQFHCYWSPARTDVMRCVLKPSQCIRPA